jgi:hypothetical protein
VTCADFFYKKKRIRAFVVTEGMLMHLSTRYASQNRSSLNNKTTSLMFYKGCEVENYNIHV